jgi:4-hydroxy-tetrahydrodipicolinate reductase
MADLRIGVMGAGGRMGGAIVRQVAATQGCAVVAACEAAGHPMIGRDAGEVAGIEANGVKIGSDAEALFRACEAVVEFTSPAASLAHAAHAAAARRIHVIGTTGLEPADEAALRAAAKSATLVYAPNMSLAVNILFALTRQVARMLDDEFDVEIVEMHHKHKVDAPSGTALGLGRAAAAGRGVEFAGHARLVREGQIGARKRGEIGFATLRGGDVVGDHSVIFAADGERLELAHKASSRQIFARGAVRAALWAKGKPPGLYSMADVLGLEKS